MSEETAILAIGFGPDALAEIRRRLVGESIEARLDRAADADDLRTALAGGGCAVVLASARPPDLAPERILGLVREARPDLPLILVTEPLGEERALDLMRLGVWDIVLLPGLARLGDAVRRAVDESTARRARREAEAASRAARLAALNMMEDAVEARRTAEHANAQWEREAAGRFRAEDAVRENERLLRQVIDLVPHHIFAKDRDGRFLFVNRAAAEACGMTPEQMVGRLESDLRADLDHVARFLGDDRAVIDSGNARTIPEEPIAYPDGTVHYLRTTKMPFTPPGSDAPAVLGVAVDITELRAAEAARRTSETRFVHMADCIEDVLYAVDGTTREFQFANPAFERLLGYTLDDVARMGGREAFLAAIIQDRRFEEQDRVFGELTPERSTGPLPPWEAWWRRKDGELRCIEDRWIPVFENGHLVSTFGVLRDITDRKRHEAERENFHRQHQLALNAAQMGWWHFDPVSGISSWDERYAAIFGVAGAQAENDRILKLLHPDDLPRVWAAVAAALDPADPRPYAAEYRIIRPDGAVRWIEAHGLSLFEGEGPARRAVALVGTVADVTERRQAEDALRESRDQLRTLGDNLPGGILYQLHRAPDGATSYTYISAGVARVFGFSADRVLSDPGPFWELIVEEDRAILDAAQDRSAREMSVFDLEFRQRNVEGDVRWIHARSIPRRLGDGSILWDGVATDITEHKRAEEALAESEQRFRKIFEDGALGMVMTSAPRGTFMAANTAFCRMLGYGEDELKQMSFVDVTHPDHRGTDSAAIKRIWTGESQRYTTEKRYVRKNGETVWGSVTASPILGKDGGLLYILAMIEDITERKRAEAALRESESRYRALVETTFDWIWEVDAEGRYTYASPKVFDLLGLTPAEVVGRTPFDLMPAEEAGRLRAVFAELTGQRRPFAALENVNVHKDGRLVVLETSAVPVLGPHGEFRGYRGMDRDITERKRADAALRQSEAEFRAMFETASIGMAQADPVTRRWLRVNQKMSEITGYPEAELLALEIPEVTHPDDREADREAFQRVVRGEAPDYRMEKRYIRKDGAIAWVNVNMTVIRDAAGQPVRTMATIEDITPRKHAEHTLRLQGAALQAAANAIVITDPDGTIEWANPAFTAFTGYSVAEAVGRNPRELVRSGQQDAAFYRVMWNIIRDGQVWHGEIVNRRKDGSLYTEDMTITPLRDAQGTIRHYIAIKQDVTQRKSLEAQLLRTQRLESVGRLASGIAHDLNNILAPMLMAPPLLRESLHDEAALGIVDTIESSAKRGAAVIRQLLTFGRGLKGERVPLQLRSLVREMLKIIAETFPKDIVAKGALPSDVPLVIGDATQLHQVLMNLCVNARDAMPGGGRLTLGLETVTLDAAASATHPDAHPGRYVVMSVADTGTGIAPEIVDKLFDPFFTTKGIGEGTGLGLSTVLGIVQKHGGFIEVRSKMGEGAEFRVHLPAQERAAEEATPDARPDRPQGRNELVLVVDDETSVRAMARRMLQHNGYRVVEAQDGAEALLMLDNLNQPIHAVVTDLQMPRMDGFALIRALRRKHTKLPIIATGGFPPAPAVLADLGIDPHMFIPKPFTTEVLLRLLRQALG